MKIWVWFFFLLILWPTIIKLKNQSVDQIANWDITFTNCRLRNDKVMDNNSTRDVTRAMPPQTERYHMWKPWNKGRVFFLKSHRKSYASIFLVWNLYIYLSIQNLSHTLSPSLGNQEKTGYVEKKSENIRRGCQNRNIIRNLCRSIGLLSQCGKLMHKEKDMRTWLVAEGTNHFDDPWGPNCNNSDSW